MHALQLQNFLDRHTEFLLQGRVGWRVAASGQGNSRTDEDNSGEQHSGKRELGQTTAITGVLGLWTRIGRANNAAEARCIVGFVVERSDLRSDWTVVERVERRQCSEKEQ